MAVRREMRCRVLLMTISLILATLTPAAQKHDSASPQDQVFLTTGVFLYEPGDIHPTYLDAFKNRPHVVSPDDRLEVTVTGPPESLGAWVTVLQRDNLAGGLDFPVWPLEGSADVLWRPDSQAFALTDHRYANNMYVLVCGTEFRMGEDGPGLGVPITNLTPIVRKAFEQRAAKYYGADDNYETRLFYAMALRWVGSDDLLLGVSATTEGPATFPDHGVNIWAVAYLVDVRNEKLVREVNKEQLLSEYKIRVNEH
jgi:hypothetical protein